MVKKQKIKGKEFTLTKVVNNLMRYYALATPEDIKAGKDWYPEANKLCQNLSDQYGLQLWKAAGIVAALSPQTSWNVNKDMATSFIRARGRGFMGNRERTIKAKKIFNAEHPSEVHDHLGTKPEGALKTRAFYRNIVLPGFCDTTTIDRHALAACFQRPDKTFPLEDSWGKLTKAQYDFISLCYATAAKRVGMIPAEMQALIWIVYRKQRGLEKPTPVPAVEGGFVPADIEDF